MYTTHYTLYSTQYNTHYTRTIHVLYTYTLYSTIQYTVGNDGTRNFLLNLNRTEPPIFFAEPNRTFVHMIYAHSHTNSS